MSATAPESNGRDAGGPAGFERAMDLAFRHLANLEAAGWPAGPAFTRERTTIDGYPPLQRFVVYSVVGLWYRSQSPRLSPQSVRDEVGLLIAAAEHDLRAAADG
jgi:hypothetical protein